MHKKICRDYENEKSFTDSSQKRSQHWEGEVYMGLTPSQEMIRKRYLLAMKIGFLQFCLIDYSSVLFLLFEFFRKRKKKNIKLDNRKVKKSHIGIKK